MVTEERIYDALRTVMDPEAGMNIVDLGLVYGVTVDAASIRVRLTMTSAACPMGEDIVEEARRAITRAAPETADVDVQLVWDPPWQPSMMSEEARAFFGWPGA
jgi:metal-sulfur cluster biosynthetic enzyme